MSDYIYQLLAAFHVSALVAAVFAIIDGRGR